MKLEMKIFQLGSYGTNCYLLWNENKEGYFFDCGGTELEKVQKVITENNISMKALILTHGHYDHIKGVNKFKELYPDVKIYIGEEDAIFLTDSNYSLSAQIDGTRFKCNETQINTLKDGDVVGDFVVISTPGHTIGSKCFYNEENKIMISGDTMFRRSFGRYDFPTGNGETLMKSLKKLCDNYPESIEVYSGHGDSTILGDEKKFLKSHRYI